MLRFPHADQLAKGFHAQAVCEDVVVDYDIRLPDAVAEHLRRFEELRATSAEAQAAAAAEIRSAARQLHEQGVALRDVGKVLGVSHQRAHQLVS